MLNYIYNLATDKYTGPLAALLKLFLFLLSVVYGLIIRTLIFFYRLKPYQADCKVISVGNVTLGGTGKTPLVEYIARYLKQDNRKVAVITRGYMRGNVENIVDEPRMLEENLKGVAIIVNADRVAGIKRAIAEHRADIVILDDGFQQWRIKKDLDIVTIDSSNPFGNRRMIPRGILRQPLSSLKAADIFVLTKIDIGRQVVSLKGKLSRLNPRALIVEAEHKPMGFYELAKPGVLLNADVLKGKAAVLVSGIADPGSFKRLIDELGISASAVFEFRDHHNYSREDLRKIIRTTQEKEAGIIIITEKDAVKFNKLRIAGLGPQIFVLKIKLQVIKNEELFIGRLSGIYSA